MDLEIRKFKHLNLWMKTPESVRMGLFSKVIASPDNGLSSKFCFSSKINVICKLLHFGERGFFLHDECEHFNDQTEPATENW